MLSYIHTCTLSHTYILPTYSHTYTFIHKGIHVYTHVRAHTFTGNEATRNQWDAPKIGFYYAEQNGRWCTVKCSLVPSHLLRTKQTALWFPGKFQLLPPCPGYINPRSQMMIFPFRRITLPCPPSLGWKRFFSVKSPYRPGNPVRMKCWPRSRAAPSISPGKPRRNLVVENPFPLC